MLLLDDLIMTQISWSSVPNLSYNVGTNLVRMEIIGDIMGDMRNRRANTVALFLTIRDRVNNSTGKTLARIEEEVANFIYRERKLKNPREVLRQRLKPETSRSTRFTGKEIREIIVFFNSYYRGIMQTHEAVLLVYWASSNIHSARLLLDEITQETDFNSQEIAVAVEVCHGFIDQAWSPSVEEVIKSKIDSHLKARVFEANSSQPPQIQHSFNQPVSLKEIRDLLITIFDDEKQALKVDESLNDPRLHPIKQDEYRKRQTFLEIQIQQKYARLMGLIGFHLHTDRVEQIINLVAKYFHIEWDSALSLRVAKNLAVVAEQVYTSAKLRGLISYEMFLVSRNMGIVDWNIYSNVEKARQYLVSDALYILDNVTLDTISLAKERYRTLDYTCTLANEYFPELLQVASFIDDTEGHYLQSIIAKTCAACSFVRQHQTDSALHYLNAAEEDLEKYQHGIDNTERNTRRLWILLFRASISLQVVQSEEAMDYLQEAKQLVNNRSLQENHRAYVKGWMHYMLCRVHREFGDFT